MKQDGNLQSTLATLSDLNKLEFPFLKIDEVDKSAQSSKEANLNNLEVN